VVKYNFGSTKWPPRPVGEEVEMLIEHDGRTPTIDPTAYVAPTAVICGDVAIGPNSCVGFGAVLTAEGGPIRVGAHCIIRENVVIRGTREHPTVIGDHVLVGPRAYLVGCTVEASVFLATGVTVFHGARIGERAEVRVNGTVHLLTRLPPDATVPIGWVAVGDPAQILSPDGHQDIWAIQEPLNFPKTAYGVDRPPSGRTDMPEITQRIAEGLQRHRRDRVL
jgi:carbonic anhydrase/acetyltransferase-like protein (isoleucine patch superfamily)